MRRMLPLTFKVFKAHFSTNSRIEYFKYLAMNKHQHHYNNMSLAKWFSSQTRSKK